VVPGEHYVRADSPDEFAEAIVGLLKDRSRRRALGEAGRRLVEEHYSWGQVGRQFERHCEEIASSHAP
jgi:glycosyltransferase involved in cell wall biosynthesis